MEKMSFAEQLAAARKAAGLTQAQLGEKMHMSRQGICHWELGHSLPDVENLKRLSTLLNYDFINSKFLAQEEPQPSADGVEASGKGPLWRQPVFYLSAAVLVLIGLLAWVLLAGRPGSEPESDAGLPAAPGVAVPTRQADVRIVPHQNPITPEIDPFLSPEPWWIYRLTIQETAGVNFTIERMITTYRMADGTEYGIEQSGESVAAGAGTNVLCRGLPIYWNGAQPLHDYVSITIRLEGVDANGNALSFEEVIRTERRTEGE